MNARTDLEVARRTFLLGSATLAATSILSCRSTAPTPLLENTTMSARTEPVGASGGQPRNVDKPAYRTEDIHGMADYISRYPGVGSKSSKATSVSDRQPPHLNTALGRATLPGARNTS